MICLGDPWCSVTKLNYTQESLPPSSLRALLCALEQRSGLSESRMSDVPSHGAQTAVTGQKIDFVRGPFIAETVGPIVPVQFTSNL